MPSENDLNVWSLTVAIAALVVTNLVALSKIYFQTQASWRLQARTAKIEIFSEQINKFYNPLYTLIKMNGELFHNAGPSSFPNDHIQRESAAKVWENIKQDFILPNNKKIQDIIRECSHLISETDDISNYLKLYEHTAMFDIFQDTPTELYSKFQFPISILEHIDSKRRDIIQKLDHIRKE